MRVSNRQGEKLPHTHPHTHTHKPAGRKVTTHPHTHTHPHKLPHTHTHKHTQTGGDAPNKWGDVMHTFIVSYIHCIEASIHMYRGIHSLYRGIHSLFRGIHSLYIHYIEEFQTRREESSKQIWRCNIEC